MGPGRSHFRLVSPHSLLVSLRDRRTLLAFVFLFALGERSAKSRRLCPSCAEPVLPAAKMCPYCRTELAAGWADSATD